jgi:hypothetical protein
MMISPKLESKNTPPTIMRMIPQNKDCLFMEVPPRINTQENKKWRVKWGLLGLPGLRKRAVFI